MIVAWLTLAFSHPFDPAVVVLNEVSAQTWSVHYEAPLSVSPEVQPVVACERNGSLYRCPEGLPPIEIAHRGQAPVDVVVTAVWADGVSSTEVLGPGQATAHPARVSRSDQAVWLGIRHLWKGWDHLALVALLVARFPGWAAVGALTGFTVGHALSLSAVVWLGFAIPSAPVEVLIAGSVVWLARQAMMERSALQSPVLSRSWLGLVGLGLLHGLGFAGGLMDSGLPRTGVGGILVGFHLGLEAVQLAFAVLFGVLWTRVLIRIRRGQVVWSFVGGWAVWEMLQRLFLLGAA